MCWSLRKVLVTLLFVNILVSEAALNTIKSCFEYTDFSVVNCVTNISEKYAVHNQGVFISDTDSDTSFLNVFLKQFNKLQITPLCFSKNYSSVYQSYNFKSSFFIVLINNETIEALKQLDNQIRNLISYTEIWNSKGRFIIVLQHFNFSFPVVEEMIQLLWKYRIVNLIVVTRPTINTISIYTAEPFGKNGCIRDARLILLDQFINGVIDITQNLFPRKIPKRFPNCAVKVSTLNEPPFTIRNPMNDSKTPYIDGIEIKLIELISKVNGFILTWMAPPKSDTLKWGDLLNGTWYGIIGDVAKDISDVAFASLRPTVTRLQGCDFTNPYMVFSMSWFVPRARLEKQWKIQIFPNNIWLLLLTIYIFTSFFCFFLSKFKYDKLPEHSSYLSLSSCLLITFQIALGNPSTMPNNIKLRIVFVVWAIFQMHVNTAYTSNLVSIFTNPGNGKQIENLEDLKNSGLRVCMIPELGITKLKYSENDVQYLFNRSFSCPDLADAVKKLSTQRNFSLLANDVNVYFNSGNILRGIHELYHKLALFSVSMCLSKGSLFLDSFNHVIRTAVEGGLIKKWETDLNSSNNQLTDGSAIVPLCMTMPYIQDVFCIICIGWVISLVVFLLEVFSYKYKLNTLKVNI